MDEDRQLNQRDSETSVGIKLPNSRRKEEFI